MNSLQIEQLVLNDELSSKLFGGVIAADQMKRVENNDGKLYVINSDPSSEPGQHWMVLNNSSVDNYISFFDSLGNSPKKYGTYFKSFLELNNYKYNSRRLQGESRTCAHFCLYYIFYTVRGYTMQSIVNSFTLDIGCNDIIVLNFVNRMLLSK